MKKSYIVVILSGIVLCTACFFVLKDEIIEKPVGGKTNDKNTVLSYNSGIQGVVKIGPTCPIMRENDTSCADRPYVTSVQIIQIGSPKSAPFATVNTDSNGRFEVMLPPGNYGVQPIGGQVLPRCETQDVTVVSDKIEKIDLSCDSGIR